MNIIIKCIILLITFFTLSCNGKLGVNFKVTNNTDSKIDSLIVTNGFHFVMLKNLEIKETKSGFIDFEVKNPRHDGNYGIELYAKNKVKKQLFGYF